MSAEASLTYHVQLILDNDENLYRMRREIVQEFMSGPDANYTHLLGDQLQEWVGEMSESESDSLLRTEIVSTALAFVSWREMAKGYIEEEAE